MNNYVSLFIRQELGLNCTLQRYSLATLNIITTQNQRDIIYNIVIISFGANINITCQRLQLTKSTKINSSRPWSRTAVKVWGS